MPLAGSLPVYAVAGIALAGLSAVIGAFFVVCVVAFRRGFVGELMAWLKRRANYTAAGASKAVGNKEDR